MKDLEKAKSLLFEEDLTLAVVKNGEIIFKSKDKGIRPMFILATELKGKAKDGALADRVIGKGAAILAGYIGIKEIKITGLKPYESHTNYILIRLLSWNEEYIFNFLLKQGIIIRKCSSFDDLPSGYIRVAVKDKENNERLVKALLRLKEGVND